ncbi:response regulator [Agrobacterium tumefaciens]|uniref:response regulator n=1 Tax=Agrobacterium tumefaciens TaxID=358 RepID=UPI001CC18E15|nr:response regulator [Agrobacterium tumefaciens]
MRLKYILFVEDNENNRTLFQHAINDWNEAHADGGKAFVPHMSASYDEAVEALRRFKFDCAILDLRLPNVTGQDSPDVGNQLAKDVLFEQGLPLAILSGHPDEIDGTLADLEIIRTFNKGDEDGYEQAIAWLADKWEMMEALRAAKASIDQSAAAVFAKRLWPQWATFSELEDGNVEKITKIIARQYVSHIADILGLDNDGAVGWHPFESYNIPSLFDTRAHTGDIFKIGDDLWIVLSPQCDMATQKVSNAILAKCLVGLPATWAENIENLRTKPSQAKVEKATRFFNDLVNQNLAVSIHFLPPLPGSAEPLRVTFPELMTMSLAELNGSLASRVASVSSPFIPNLVQRFGAYISRTGQPNLEIEHFVA